MNKTVLSLSLYCCLLTGVFVSSKCLAEQGGRPDYVTLSNFQFGPVNRWSFSHLREVLPTVNIEHDSERVLALEQSDSFVSDFSVLYRGQEQPINEIAQSWYVDGLLILKDRSVIFEKYYGHLTEESPPTSSRRRSSTSTRSHAPHPARPTIAGQSRPR